MKTPNSIEYWLMCYYGICPPSVYSRHKSLVNANKAMRKAEKEFPRRVFKLVEVKWLAEKVRCLTGRNV